MDKQEFDRKYELFTRGFISGEEWDNYCLLQLLILMGDNSDVLKRLKEI